MTEVSQVPLGEHLFSNGGGAAGAADAAGDRALAGKEGMLESVAKAGSEDKKLAVTTELRVKDNRRFDGSRCACSD